MVASCRAEDWVQKGEAAFAGGNYAEAARCFQRGQEQKPYDPQIYSRLGMALWRAGDQERALENITRALELDPNDRTVILDCITVFKDLGRDAEAREILDAYLERNPWDREATEKGALPFDPAPAEVVSQGFDPAAFLVAEGEAQYGKGRPDRARFCFELALEHDPKNAKSCNNLGVLAWEDDRLEEALNWFYRALELDSDDPEILKNGSQALAAAGELETALELLELYLCRHPEDGSAWQSYRSLVKETAAGWRPDGLNGSTAEVYLRMGEQLSAAGDAYGAAEAYGRASLLDPQSAEPLYRLGMLHRRIGQVDDAVAMFREALAKKPNHGDAVLALAECYRQQGLEQETRSLLQGYLQEREDQRAAILLEEIEHGRSGAA